MDPLRVSFVVLRGPSLLLVNPLRVSFVVCRGPSLPLVDPLELRFMYGALQLALQCIGYLGGWELYTPIDRHTNE